MNSSWRTGTWDDTMDGEMGGTSGWNEWGGFNSIQFSVERMVSGC